MVGPRCPSYPRSVSTDRIHSTFPEPLAPPVASAALAADITGLPPASRLLHQGEFAVYCCGAEEAPAAMADIARLRELSFRQVGEGTGRAQDRDGFDDHYQQLFVWQCATQEILGAYRLALSQPIVRRYGVQGLYSNSLFDYGLELLEHIGPGIELGRSFVHPDHQGNGRVLRLLWAGIGVLLERYPEVRSLFGPVSISPNYSKLARALMLKAIEHHHMDPALSALVRPRSPCDLQSCALSPCHISALAGLADPTALSRYLLGQGEGPGLPMLIKHYLALQGRFAAFSVDAAFNNTLDGLVFVQVRSISQRLRSRLGKAADSTGRGTTQINMNK